MRGRALALGACVVAASFGLLGAAVAAAPPQMDVTPSSQLFGELCVGATSSPKTFTIKNTAQDGADPLVINSINRSGSTDFTPASIPTPAPIQAGDTSTFSVTFSPNKHEVNATATYKVSGNDGNRSVTVTGTGRDRRISSDRSSVSFGEQRVGTRSPNQTLILRNPGQDSVKVTSMRRVGNNPGDFRVTAPALPFSIGAGNFVSATVSFQPTGAGLRNGTLEIGSDACGKPKLSVSLVGSGAVSKVLVDPNPIDVGASARDVQGPPVAVTVSNAGGAPLKITAVQVLGTDAEDFVLEDLPTMPVTIPVSDSFIFHVRMTPSAEGARVARINILSDDPSAPSFSVDLRGTGGKASPSPTPSASASPSANASPKATNSTKPQSFGASPNDNLAIILVIVAVFLAFLGLIVIRRFIAVRDDEE